MTEPAEELAFLHAAWLAHFGEPPPIVAEPSVMRRVMSQVLDRARAQTPGPRGPGAWTEVLENGT